MHQGYHPARTTCVRNTGFLIFLISLSCGMIGVGGCSGLGASGAMRAGEGMRGPWWMRRTALGPQGELRLDHQPWWPRACELEVGQGFAVDADDAPDGSMFVRCERFRNRSREVEAIVWIIDDDSDGSAIAGGDFDSDCYVVDYDRDGVVDRMVDYIDNDDDNDPDEMDIRYFVEGELRQLWCGHDLDDDNIMWDLAGYEYSGDFFKSDPHGDEMIFMNRFDPQLGEWGPISECPFAFYDLDGDGYSEEVVRVSAVPMRHDATIDPDYANDSARYRGPWRDEMRQMGVINIRHSFDIDNGNGPDAPLHYEFGFNLVGATPYTFAGMEHFNPKRRPPQVTRVIPHKRLRSISRGYHASQTGFSWHEHEDDTIAIGAPPREEEDRRWEGVFWLWERRFMENTGGPGQKWNVRREWSDRPSDHRRLYYSGVDRRIHLFGAEEGWIQLGHFGGLGEMGEIRMFDTDGNGLFDRWEVYAAGADRPSRVTTVRDEKTRWIDLDYKMLSAFYTGEVLPEAMSANDRLMTAMARVRPFEPPDELRRAMGSGPDTHRRYAQDLVRELHYQDLRQHLQAMAQGVLRGAETDDLRRLKPGELETKLNSHTAWRLVRACQRLEVAYGQGDYDRACDILGNIERGLDQYGRGE